MAIGNEPQPLGIRGPIVPNPTNYPDIYYYTYGKVVFVCVKVTVNDNSTITIPNFPIPMYYVTGRVFNDDGLVDVQITGKFNLYPKKNETHRIDISFCYLTRD